MTTADLAVIGTGFASALGGVMWNVMGVVGCIFTGSVVLLVAWFLLGWWLPYRTPQHAATRPSLVMPELGDDTLAMLRGEVPDAVIEQWLREGGRNG